jgi:hypothetical protein
MGTSFLGPDGGIGRRTRSCEWLRLISPWNYGARDGNLPPYEKVRRHLSQVQGWLSPHRAGFRLTDQRRVSLPGL